LPPDVLALPKVVVTDADYTCEQLQERVSLSVAGLSRVRREGLSAQFQ
jgi:hypothetical protein